MLMSRQIKMKELLRQLEIEKDTEENKGDDY